MTNNFYSELEKKNICDEALFLEDRYIITAKSDGPNGRVFLAESFTENGKMLFVSSEETRTLVKYADGIGSARRASPSVNDALDRGEDILAGFARSDSFAAPSVLGLLPEFEKGSYIALGHPSSDSSVTVDGSGRIFDQSRFYDRDNFPSETVIFCPAESSVAEPRQWLLDGIYPVLFSRFSNVEYTYFVEKGDLRLAPSVWIRAVTLDGDKVKDMTFKRIGTDACNVTDDNSLSAERFYEALYGIVALCDDFISRGVSISLPDKRLERSFYGTHLAHLSLFHGPQARYGNRFYGLSGHDNFPPNYITSILSLTISGRLDLAGLFAGYLLTYVIDPLGQVLYRQGDGQAYGFSASELGQLLWVLSRYHNAAGALSAVSAHKGRILAICNYLASRVCALEDEPDIFTVRTCAEADANERVADYLQNIAWTIRGLESALAILGDFKGTDRIRLIVVNMRKSFEAILSRKTISTNLGSLVPFCLQYPYVPLTMSACLDTTEPVGEQELREYFAQTSHRGSSDYPPGRDFMENRYSNYRYYPELLSSSLLSEEQERVVRLLRERHGGELLGMIRFNRWLDDWPAYNLAIHYMERGLIDKFLLLLFAHAYCHGLIDFHTYYEQVAFKNEKAYARADTSCPSLLLNGIMIAFAFVYESVDGKRVDILRGVPSDWYAGEGCRADGLCTSFGKVSVRIRNGTVMVRLEGSFNNVRLFLNGHKPKGKLPDGVELADGYLAVNLSSGEFSIEIT